MKKAKKKGKSFIGGVKDSFSLSKKKWKWFIPMGLIDIAFFSVFAVVLVHYYTRIVDSLSKITEINTNTMSNAQQLLNQNGGIASPIQINPGVFSEIHHVMILVLLMIFFIYLTWTIFIGFNISLAERIASNKKNRLFKVWGIYSLQSLAFTIIMTCGFYLFLRFSWFNKLSLLSVFSQGILNLLYLVVLFFLFYVFYVWNSYLAKVQRKKILKTYLLYPFKKIKRFLLNYVFSLAVFLVLFYCFAKLFYLNFLLSIIFGIIIFLPAVSFLRIHMFRQLS